MLPLKATEPDPELSLTVRRALAILEGASDMQLAQSGGVMLSDLAFTDPSLVFGTSEDLGHAIRPFMRHLLKTRGNALVRDTLVREDELALFHIAARMAVVLAHYAKQD